MQEYLKSNLLYHASYKANTQGKIYVGMTMHIGVVERYEALFQALPCCKFAKKANQRLVLCVQVLL